MVKGFLIRTGAALLFGFAVAYTIAAPQTYPAPDLTPVRLSINGEGQASGVAIGPRTILTAGHAGEKVGEGGKAGALFPDGSQHVVIATDVKVWKEKKIDYAIMTTKTDLPHYTALKCDPLKVTEEFWGISNPEDFYFLKDRFRVLSTDPRNAHFPEPYLITVTGYMSEGASGGPLYAEDGRVVGILVAYFSTNVLTNRGPRRVPLGAVGWVVPASEICKHMGVTPP